MTNNKLNRFTNLSALIDILMRKKIMLVDPSSWDDQNDYKLIEIYKNITKVKNLFALCFTSGDETYHHWTRYANGSNGCCIEFDADKLIKIFDNYEGGNLLHGEVVYKKISEIKDIKISPNEIPFYKRISYQCEKEYRVIWCGNDKRKYVEIEIPLEIIRKITFNQQMHQRVFDSLKILLGNYLTTTIINQSTLIQNDDWIKTFDAVHY